MRREAARSVSVAEAKKHLSDLLGRVKYGGETVVITRRGRPMAQLVPPAADDAEGLAAVRGWLDENDPLFARIDATVAGRATHRPRSFGRRTRKAS